MVNYENGKIYKIVCSETNQVYYGSTTQKYLCNRLAGHKYKKQSTMKNFVDMKIYLVENYSCNSKSELEDRENYYIKNFECVNQRQAPSISIIRRRETQYKYVAKNKFKIMCECGFEISKLNISTHRKTKKHLSNI